MYDGDERRVLEPTLNLFTQRRGRDRMVDGFTSTYAISDYHH
jgi:hypothetical protein